MTGKADIEIKKNHFCWINDKALNKLENSSSQVDSFYTKIKGLNNSNHQMQQENAHMMEELVQF